MTFSSELRRLWAAAGDPTLKTVSEAVAARGRPAGIVVKRSLLARLSDWRNGKHLPREFEGVLMLTIAELLARAGARDALAGLPTRMEQWEELWRQAREAEAEAPKICPYPGLAPYGVNSADHFFGRGEQVSAIVGLIDDARAAGGGLVALVGVSGSGKSSLLAAGVRPALTGRGLRVAAMRPGTDPIEELARTLGPATAPDVLIVDQAEELFTMADDGAAAEFLEALTDLVASGGEHPRTVLIGLRADYVSEWLAFPQLLDAMNERTYLLGPMRREELEQVITRPPATVGVKVDPGLTERIIADFCGPRMEDYDAGALPLLNHALATLWGHRTGNRLSLKDYEASGGVFGALDDTAEGMWSELSGPTRAEMKPMLLRLVHVDGTGRVARMARSRTDLCAGDPGTAAARRAALDALLEARLLVVDGDDNVTFTHEIVMRVWVRLRDWIADNRGELLARQRLESAADVWADNGEDAALLLRGAALEQARAAANTGGVSQRAVAYLAAADQTAQHSARLRRGGQIALVVIAILGLTLSLFAYRSRTEAIDQRTAAELGRLTAEADRLRYPDPTMAALLAQYAELRYPSDDNRSRLVATGNLPLARAIDTGGGAVYSVDVSPDGEAVAATGSDGSARIWRIDEPQADPVVLEGHSSFVTSVIWSPDGSQLATTSDDGTARIWPEPGSGTDSRVLRGHDGRVVYAAWAPDGRRLVTAGMDGTARVWDVGSGAQLAELAGHDADIRTVAWSPDGAVIATGSADETARLWDGATYAPRGVIRGHSDTVHALDFTRDGRMLATGSDDATVRLWNVGDPAAPAPVGLPMTAHTGPVWTVDFSADDRRLVSSSVDGTARVWNVAQPAVPVQTGQPLNGSAASFFAAKFTPDGRRVVTSGADGRIRIWSLPGTVLSGHTGRVIAPSIAAGRMLTGSSEGSLQLWDVDDPTAPELLGTARTAGDVRIDQVSLSADGRLAAAATQDSVVTLWPLDEAGAFGPPQRLPVDTLDQQRVLFAPVGRLLLTGARDDSFQLWDVGPDAAAHKKGPPLVHGTTGTWATAAAWSPDARRLVTAGVDGVLDLWDVADPDRPRLLATAQPEHPRAVNAVAWAGEVIAAGGDGGVIRWWRVHDERLTLLAERRQPRHGTIRTLDFVDDGRRLISAGDGQTLVVWDTADPAAPRQWGQPIGPAGAGRWYATATPDGEAVAVGGDHGVLEVVILNPGYATARIDAATPPLTAEERARFAIR